mmetsp:Transcript_56961/g.101087  ORF Transcript_56961/g.101087 Transcript_56961/m.101087 type:complete len:103 (-) Transcript_56961:820-1128(-)
MAGSNASSNWMHTCHPVPCDTQLPLSETLTIPGYGLHARAPSKELSHSNCSKENRSRMPMGSSLHPGRFRDSIGGPGQILHASMIPGPVQLPAQCRYQSSHH